MTSANTLTTINQTLKNNKPKFTIILAGEQHLDHAPRISEEMAASAKVRGTGIARRPPEFLQAKMREGKAVIATTTDGEWAGFCYIESWQNGEYVANSGLIVAPQFRKYGLAKQIKAKIFDLSKKRFPKAKIFGLTTSRAVMKINSGLGYEPVTYGELTQDEQFWAGCQSCVNFAILTEKNRKNCLCTAMLYNPADHPTTAEKVAKKVSQVLSRVSGKKEDANK